MTNTNWTDTPPNTPGWYWVRNQKHVSVQHFPYCGMYPEHWATKRQNTIDVLIEDGEIERANAFANLDLNSFVVEYSGPIFPPN